MFWNLCEKCESKKVHWYKVPDLKNIKVIILFNIFLTKEIIWKYILISTGVGQIQWLLSFCWTYCGVKILF